MTSVVITVLGSPAPKGSARAFVNKKTGRAIVAPSGSKQNQDRLALWDADVRAGARDVVGERAEPVFVGKPLLVELEFRIARPGGHWNPKTGKLKPSADRLPAKKPDVDKLARATLDSLNGLVFDDDSRIVSLRLMKIYAAPGEEGARIAVYEYPMEAS